MALLVVCFFSIIGCSSNSSYLHIQKVGMLVEGTIEDQPWDKKGHEALLKISKEFDVSVYLKEKINTKYEMIQAVDQLVKNGVNLIFGHSDSYGRVFVDISYEYPDVQFVYLNGNYFSENVTSVNFNSHAVGFFNGMIASKMTETKQVGLIAAYAWQPEIEGFYEGAKYQNKYTNVQVQFVNDWNKDGLALQMYDSMKESNVDVFYSIGDTFSFSIAEKAKEDDAYALGYISANADNKKTLLASTNQHIDTVYLTVAKSFNEKKLEGGVLTFDFQDGAISLEDFSPAVPKKFQKLIKKGINTYIKEGLLPHES